VRGVGRAAVLAAALAFACGKATPGASAPDGSRPVDASAAPSATAAAADPVLEALWVSARSGDADDLARLADREGASGLAARAQLDPGAKFVALRALAYAPDPGALAALPVLADTARGGDDALADAALESAIDLAARPRRQLDPEDAAEMKAGCDTLLALAGDGKTARTRRVKAIRALRMLADRGGVDPGAIPSDLDAR